MSDAPQFDPDASESQPRKKNSGLKWILIIFAGLCGICCCGVVGLGIYGWSQFGMSMDPAVARTRTSEIVDIQMPEGFDPKFSMSMMDTMKMVFWIPADGQGMIVLAEGKGAVSQEELRRQVDQSMQQQGQQQNITIEEKTEKEYTVRGETATFEIAKGKTKDGVGVWQVIGGFPSKGGSAVIIMILPQEKFDEAEIDAIIESIQ